MDRDARRLRIRGKLAEGTLPRQPLPRVWADPAGGGERCDGCDGVVGPGELVMGGLDRVDRAIRFHVECFRLWERARQCWDDAESSAIGPEGPPAPQACGSSSPPGPPGQRG
jgi:hypothetical protein